jgi:hypothetical protein
VTVPEVTAATKAEINLLMPADAEAFYRYLRENAQHARPRMEQLSACRNAQELSRLILKHGNVLTPKSHSGKTLIICGAGPSLRQHHQWLLDTPAHEVWACNGAANYLHDHQLPMTHAVTVDGSEEMFSDPYEWQTTYDITYMVASCVHPGLIPHLKAQGRRFKMFHSYLGMKNPEDWAPPANYAAVTARERAAGDQWSTDDYELFVYRTMYPSTARAGYGLNSVPRALCLGLWMDFKKIYVVGADCACAPDAPVMPAKQDARYTAWLDQLLLYADGRTARKYGDFAVVIQGILHGRLWHTRPDMLISAQHLMVQEKQFFPRVELIGDTLPNALKTMPEGFLEHLPTGEQGSIKGLGLQTEEIEQLQQELLTTTTGR